MKLNLFFKSKILYFGSLLVLICTPQISKAINSIDETIVNGLSVVVAPVVILDAFLDKIQDANLRAQVKEVYKYAGQRRNEILNPDRYYCVLSEKHRESYGYRELMVRSSTNFEKNSLVFAFEYRVNIYNNTLVVNHLYLNDQFGRKWDIESYNEETINLMARFGVTPEEYQIWSEKLLKIYSEHCASLENDSSLDGYYKEINF